MTDVTDAPMFNPFEEGFFEDPREQFALLRDQNPVHLSPVGVWMVFRYQDCFDILRDPELSVDYNRVVELNPDAAQERLDQFSDALGEQAPQSPRDRRSMLNIDPPDHTRIRRLLSKVFTPRRVEELRPMVQRLVDGILTKMESKDEAELISDLAFPLPFAVISEMLGMPEGDSEELRSWSHAVVKTLDPIISDTEVREAFTAGAAMESHISEVIEWKRKNLSDDILSALITAEEDGDRLSLEELIDQVVLLFVAGHETTVNLIGNGTYRLLQHPDQLQLLRDNPDLIQSAVEELLRFDSPVQLSRRITLKTASFAGTEVPAGTFVMTCLGSANHDPEQFGPNAHELDIRRENASRHLSFGSGVHHCLGAALARIEGQVAIGSLVQRFPKLAVADGSGNWNGRIVLHGLDTLNVTLG